MMCAWSWSLCLLLHIIHDELRSRYDSVYISILIMLLNISSCSTGEFIVEVTVSNLVSSASLKGHVFVVLEPCQPPPVKNMGPSKIQVSEAANQP